MTKLLTIWMSFLISTVALGQGTRTAIKDVISQKWKKGNKIITYYELGSDTTIESSNYDRGIYSDKIIKDTLEIYKSANFTLSEFISIADFGFAQFDCLPNFDFTKFKSKAIFNYSNFYSESLFRDVQFDALADFNHASFKRSIYFVDTQFHKKADFEKAQFYSAQFNFAQFDSQANFSRCNFNSSGIFVETKFYSTAHFPGTLFKYRAFFDNTHFEKKVSFRNARFHGHVNFKNSKFVSEVDFRGAHFTQSYGGIYFKDVVFKSAVSFNNVVFKQQVDFTGSSFGSTADFSGVEFSKIANFTNTVFNGKTDFYGVKLPYILVLQKVDVEKFIDFSYCLNKDEKICRIRLLWTDISKIKLNYTQFELDTFGITPKLLEPIYENLLASQKNYGFSKGYKKLDIEFQKFKYSQKTDWYWFLIHFIDQWWWNYSYNKEWVFYYTMLFISIFTFFNWRNYHFLNSEVYKIESVWSSFQEFKKNVDIENKNMRFRYLIINLFYAFFYTALIFFGIKMSFEKIKYNHRRAVIYLYFQYILGLVCLAYLANFVIKG